MRAGTTQFYDLLKDIPGISVDTHGKKQMPISLIHSRKTPLHFNAKQYGAPSNIWIDISPNYTKRQYFPGVPERIQQANPDARFIFFCT